jgi:hypothetical protein
MAEGRVEDLLSLDRDVARGAAAFARWRTALARDPEAHAGDEPLEPVRRVAGKATWQALGELAPSAAEAPRRDALRQWVVALTQARIGQADDVAWARAASEARARFTGEPPRLVSWREAWRGVVAARSAAGARLWLDAAADAAPPLAEAARTRAERRVEVARRFGYEHPWQPLVAVEPRALRAAAGRLLDATDELSRAVWKEALRGEAGERGAAAVLQAALAREAGHGWPSRLTPRWLEENFGAFVARGWRIDLPPLPPVLGAATFARALAAFGFALRLGATPTLPFALAREPAALAAHRFAFAFGSLVADPDWQARALGVGRRTALAQARVLARTMLLDARLHAARLLLGDEASPAPRDLFDELGPRLFGASLDPRLRGAWPAARDDEPARFVALLEASSFVDGLRERFDVDWFRNPQAWTQLRALAAGPAREAVDAAGFDARVDALGRTFEGALG